MAKTKTNLGGPGMISLSRLRGKARPPRSRTLLDYRWYLPPAGVLDLSQHPDQQPLAPELISAVAPLSAITENAEQAAAQRHKLIESIPDKIRGNTAFLPPEYYDDNPAEQITVFYRGLATIIDRGRDTNGRVNRLESDDLDQRPLELLVREQYRKHVSGVMWRSRYGLGHYVYDPLTDRWLLVQRWGKGQMAKRKQQIEPYTQFGALSNRHRKNQAQLETEPLPARPDDLPLASEQQLEDAIRSRRTEGFSA